LLHTGVCIVAQRPWLARMGVRYVGYYYANEAEVESTFPAERAVAQDHM